MPINHIKFVKKFLDKYTQKHSDIEADFIVDIISQVLLEAPAYYFTFDLVQEHQEFCKMCGACCKARSIPCEFFNGKTCTEWATRPDYCAEFPFYDIDGDMGLWLDPGCQFALKLADMVIEDEINKNIALLSD